MRRMKGSPKIKRARNVVEVADEFSYVSDKPQIKFVDTYHEGWVGNAPNYTDDYSFINELQVGHKFYERVGNLIEMDSVWVRGVFEVGRAVPVAHDVAWSRVRVCVFYVEDWGPWSQSLNPATTPKLFKTTDWNGGHHFRFLSGFNEEEYPGWRLLWSTIVQPSVSCGKFLQEVWKPSFPDPAFPWPAQPSGVLANYVQLQSSLNSGGRDGTYFEFRLDLKGLRACYGHETIPNTGGLVSYFWFDPENDAQDVNALWLQCDSRLYYRDID